MKVERTNAEVFNPVTITLETREELFALGEAIDRAFIFSAENREPIIHNKILSSLSRKLYEFK